MEPTETEIAQSTAVEEESAAAEREPAAAPDLEDPSLYFNRELSWLEFNDRVLQLAEDNSVPLLERVKFAAIWESNLDEEVMVRVANLQDLVESGATARAADGMAPAEVLAAIRDRVLEQRERAGRTVERELRPALAEHGIRIITPEQASDEEREELAHLFERQVFPVLTPLVIGRGRPFPYISNLSLSLAVVLRDPEKDNEILARVKVPKELLRRFIMVGDRGHTLVPLDALIADNLGSLFPGMEVLDHALFRVTRDTDYDVSDETDDVRQAVEDEIRRRRFGEVIRLECSTGLEPRLRERLVSALKIDAERARARPALPRPGHRAARGRGGGIPELPWLGDHADALPGDGRRGGRRRGGRDLLGALRATTAGPGARRRALPGIGWPRAAEGCPARRGLPPPARPRGLARAAGGLRAALPAGRGLGRGGATL